jgi:hypothetical protein
MHKNRIIHIRPALLLYYTVQKRLNPKKQHKKSWRPTYLNQHIWNNRSEPTYCMSKKGTCYYNIFSIQKVPTRRATSWGLCEAIRHQKREWTKTRSEDKSELKKKRAEPDATQMTCEPTEKVPRVKGPRDKGCRCQGAIKQRSDQHISCVHVI